MVRFWKIKSVYHKIHQVHKCELSVQGHHALMDGIHMGRFYAEMENYLEHPDILLGGG